MIHPCANLSDSPNLLISLNSSKLQVLQLICSLWSQSAEFVEFAPAVCHFAQICKHPCNSEQHTRESPLLPNPAYLMNLPNLLRSFFLMSCSLCFFCCSPPPFHVAHPLNPNLQHLLTTLLHPESLIHHCRRVSTSHLPLQAGRHRVRPSPHASLRSQARNTEIAAEYLDNMYFCISPGQDMGRDGRMMSRRQRMMLGRQRMRMAWGRSG
jgi:hypothetical protein